MVNRGSIGRVATLAALMLALGAGAGQASAAQRFASSGGSGTACSSATPCDIQQAVNGAVNGDEIVVNPGIYPLSTTLDENVALDIHGVAGMPMPQIQCNLAGNGCVRWDSGGSLTYLAITNAQSPSLYLSGGTGSQLVLRGDGLGNNVGDIQSSTLSDSIAVSTSTNAVTLSTSCAGCTNTSTYRNVTVIASGSNGRALAVVSSGAGSNTTINATNVIGRGGSGANAADMVALNTGGTAATINADHSNYANPLTVGAGATITNPTMSFNQTAAPAFVNAAGGDYHEAAGSPTIGAGITDPLNGPLDVDGDPRARGGLTDIGADEFYPPPAAVTAAAGAVGQSAATLNGSVDPMGTSGSYSFEFGTSATYGSATPAQPLALSASAVPVSAAIGGLAPGSTYHYRVTVTTSAGTVRGADRTFTTTAAPTAFAGAKLAAKRLVLKRGRVAAKVLCPTGTVGSCTGTFTLKVNVPPSRTAGRRRSVKLGSAKFSIAAGRSATVKVKASARAIAAFAAKPKLTGKATIASRDGNGAAKTIAAAVKVRAAG